MKRQLKRTAGKPRLTPESEKFRRVPKSFSVNKEVLKEFDKYTKKVGVIPSRVVENAIIRYLKTNSIKISKK